MSVPGPKGSAGDAIFVWLVAILVGLAIAAGITGNVPKPAPSPTPTGKVVRA